MSHSALLVALIFIGSVGCYRLPKFSWDGSRSSEYGVPHLIITFPDGQSDVALLERYNPIPVSGTEREMDVDACIFRGQLLHNSQVPVALTGGCPFSDTFEISIFSEKLSRHIYRMTNGIVTGHKLPWSHPGSYSNGAPIRDVALEAPQLDLQPKAGLGKKLPASGMMATVKVSSDATFRRQFGSDSTNTMRRIMAHTQPYFMMADSLTTTFILEVVGTAEIPDKIAAEEKSLRMVNKYTTKDEVNFHIYFAFQNNLKDVVGLAWIGSVCTDDFSYRTGIVEFYESDAFTAGILAHEMGHSLGMNHDFITNVTKRYDKNNETCTGIGGVMDYAPPLKWSTCSVQDLTAYYNRFEEFCMPINTNPTTTTITARSTTDPVPTTTSNFFTGISSFSMFQ